ncbi:hypothetical protein ISN45_Aa07g034130 [Arabidopsis thaliana x Arabidopsis arenosa]|uniref:DUF4283 domain-containing protein n=1 Tax=Arabidopsis thaliana x Arabidopsis arenosa TaxID=1240361 RepID=A0A8T1Y8Q6_9BRAS|nr:hypothetical protein ISN45_Aa07g034130 [Arabidopsis thaliana x Arabidopsis arenosa]
MNNIVSLSLPNLTLFLSFLIVLQSFALSRTSEIRFHRLNLTGDLPFAVCGSPFRSIGSSSFTFVMADQDLWVTLQHLNLGSERTPLRLSSEATNQRDAEHRLSLIVKGLHSSQNPAGIKVMMPKIWKLEGRITSRINEDGSVQFFFKQEHQLLTILDNGPWTYKDWLVVVDRWTRRTYPDYLRIIRFWVKILNLPDDSRNLYIHFWSTLSK